MESDDERAQGVQPLDAVMERLGLTNRDLVSSSTEQLTHKQVQKSRKGRRVTANIQGKIARALNAAAPAGEGPFGVADLFTYGSDSTASS